MYSCDKDANGDKLTVVGNTTPAHGTVTVTSTGALTYKPVANYNGTDTFNYTVSDGKGGTDIGTVTVKVTPVNDAPVARNDSYAVTKNTPLQASASQGLLANDTDVDGDALKVERHLRQAAHGRSPSHQTVRSSTHRPPTTSAPTPSNTPFPTVKGGTATGTVTVNVAAANQPPVAGGGSVTTKEDTATSGTLPGSDPEGQPLTYAISQQPTKGTISNFNASTGAYTYTPSLNANGADTIKYTVSDGTTTTAPATLNITITPVNDAPVANNDSYAVAQGGSLTVPAASGVLTNDTDVDGDTLTVTGATMPAHGTLIGSTNGCLHTPPPPVTAATTPSPTPSQMARAAVLSAQLPLPSLPRWSTVRLSPPAAP